MRTLKPSFILAFFCIFFLSVNTQGQNPLKKISKKLEKKAEKVITAENSANDKVEEVNEGSQQEISGTSLENQSNKAFIDRSNIVFYDDFDNEKPHEFPSKWTQITGALQTNQFITGDKKDGVLETISSNTRIKPTIEGDSYLGNSFKIEMLVYFHEKGNEAYTINLLNSNSVHGAHRMRVSGGVMWSGADPISRAPGIAKPGWHTFQISFNNGNMKGYLDGLMLVNDHDISSQTVSKKEFTHLELIILSPSRTSVPPLSQMVTKFTIGGEGLPLYERITSAGRIVVHDIHFDEDKYDIKETSYPALDKVLAMLQEHENMEVTIEGHTDAKGTNEDNLTLSEMRAEAVKNYMVSNGIKRYRLSSKGYGEEKPISMENTEEASAQNRRVEFVMARQ